MNGQLFQHIMSETAARFLQSAVVLDDQVVCGSLPEATDTPQPPPELQKPTKKTASEVSGPIPGTERKSGARKTDSDLHWG
uniref:Uncharacterized protein n=1 Tax=Candidatus Kentrum sp. FW TaxID=2126338 RepID=A0A450TEG2_9GAMM|nr:MAG: hypothetical protein BECKFW1821A_GA0114235_10797 [Candidatus Kentron sp. FW]VFJ65374.1 MAG: hypothetical protein BECKFW1821B_GA0114236_11031 [Candidatus Kentron sp. FW]